VKYLKSILTGTALINMAALVTPSYAGGVQSGLVASLDFRSGDIGTPSDSLVVVNLSPTSPITGAPACVRYSYWFIRDAKSEIGKQQIALLMTAKSLGRSVTITGTGACTRWGDGEDIWNINWSQ
jgi:hypothetical protein